MAQITLKGSPEEDTIAVPVTNQDRPYLDRFVIFFLVERLSGNLPGPAIAARLYMIHDTMNFQSWRLCADGASFPHAIRAPTSPFPLIDPCSCGCIFSP